MDAHYIKILRILQYLLYGSCITSWSSTPKLQQRLSLNLFLFRDYVFVDQLDRKHKCSDSETALLLRLFLPIFESFSPSALFICRSTWPKVQMFWFWNNLLLRLFLHVHLMQPPSHCDFCKRHIEIQLHMISK